MQAKIKQVLELDDQVKALAEDLYQKKSLLIMGRGYNFATCLEGALVNYFKVKMDCISRFFMIILESEGIDLHAQ